MKRLLAIVALAGSMSMAAPNIAAAQFEPFVGQLSILPYGGGNPWCPQGWAPASGQLLPISQNAALFALLGTTFGGNGTTNFALPNLNGRSPIGAGQLSGGPNFVQGQAAGSLSYSGIANGSTTFTLSVANLPSHSHQLSGSSGLNSAGSNSPNGALFATFPAAAKQYSATAALADTPMAAGAIGNTGQGQGVVAPVSVSLSNIPTQSPYIAINWCIALQGVFPQRP